MKKTQILPASILVLSLVILNILSGIIFFNSRKQNTSHVASYKYVPDLDNQEQDSKDSLQLKTLKFKTVPVGNDCNTNQLQSIRESNIAWALSPGPDESVGAGGKIKLWYTDEHPLTLGKGDVSPYDPSSHIVNPNVGDESARDVNNFPFFPALFITDVTSNPSDTSGDAENGGTPHKPDEIWGTWKPAGAYTTASPNNHVLPSGADPFPTEPNLKFKDGSIISVPTGQAHGSEIIWLVDNLGLTSGHTYRVQFIIHDGDFEGDIGEGCTTIKL